MIQIATNSAAEPIGSLPHRFPPQFARLMREIRKFDNQLAKDIREQIVKSQVAEREARLLLSKYRIRKCRRPVLHILRRKESA